MDQLKIEGSTRIQQKLFDELNASEKRKEKIIARKHRKAKSVGHMDMAKFAKEAAAEKKDEEEEAEEK